jgi:uncharacterized Fe-S center protein
LVIVYLTGVNNKLNSKVYFIRALLEEGQNVISEKAVKLFRAGGFAKCFHEKDFTAVKVHIGEHGNTTFIKAQCYKGLIAELLALKVKPFLTDTSTLYTGKRHNAVDHVKLAHERGFNVDVLSIPFLAPDGLLGTSEIAVEIDGLRDKQVMIASDIVRCQSILSLAHFTGHLATGAGATLKTLGMGCSSRKGKMRQHSALKPKINKRCTRCGTCVRYCPEHAITLGDIQAHIDQNKCIGCAECLAVCRFDAVDYDWQQESNILQESVAEYAMGVLKNKAGRAVFFNFLMSITKDCDCFDTPDMPKIVEDIGIVVSTDPVAVDSASLDMVEQAGGKPLQALIGNKKLVPDHQMDYAQKLGLGSRKYNLIEVQ